MAKTIVVALGGNAILQKGEKGTFEEQYGNVRKTCKHIVKLIEQGYNVVITHGNGPQVGAILLQNEAGKDLVPPMPLDVCGAESQGFIGYMIQQNLDNLLKGKKPVATVVTQVVVDINDPAFNEPSKPVGPFYDEKQAKKLADEKGWVVKEDAGRGWRRVVPSPDPKRIVEASSINALIKAGIVVIASGGGGIPVVEKPDGSLSGVEAVIDKDLAGERLAKEVKADILMILTSVDQVYLNYGKPEQKGISKMTIGEAKKYYEEGHFAKGSMGPKIKAAIRFIENGGKKAIITSPELATDALAGKAGTIITK